jgi:hypothetical protein
MSSLSVLVVLLASLLLCCFVQVVQGNTTTYGKLLNAYNAPLSALTSPGNLYFLEFPFSSSNGKDNGDMNNNDFYVMEKDDTKEIKLSPICGDGTPYSFVFRRGTCLCC